MAYDLDLIRAIFQEFGVHSPSQPLIRTDGVTLSPPYVVGADPTAVPAHVDRLVDVGLVQRTNDIHMKYDPDPVTLRITEAGRPWVRRAYDDTQWQQSVQELKQLLESGTGT